MHLMALVVVTAHVCTPDSSWADAAATDAAFQPLEPVTRTAVELSTAPAGRGATVTSTATVAIKDATTRASATVRLRAPRPVRRRPRPRARSPNERVPISPI